MRIRNLIHRTVLATLITSAASAQAAPKVRLLGATIRVSAPNLIGSVTAIRILPGGRLIVNDITRRQLVLLDSTLSIATIIVDSSKTTGGMFGAQPAGIIAYRGDSTLFVDPASLSMLVIDPKGKVARVMAAPRAQEIAYLVGGPFGTPAFDADNNLIYRGWARPVAAPPGSKLPSGLPFQMPVEPDSAPIISMNLATRKLDTMATYRVGHTDTKLGRDESGRLSVTTTFNPMQTIDDWAVLSDGTLAVIRGNDYHVDWIATGGTVHSTAKIPFRWHRMTDADRNAVLDSARITIDKELAALRAKILNAPPAPARPASTDGSPPQRGPSGPAEPTINVVDVSLLPEYRPAFQAGSAHADRKANLWIRTSDTADGAPVYEVIDRQGRLTDRIQFPRGRVLVGFGQGDTVLLGLLDGVGARVEESRIH